MRPSKILHTRVQNLAIWKIEIGLPIIGKIALVKPFAKLMGQFLRYSA